ncbi:Aspartic proteinase nepenthesin-2 [Nymphaea thermarum]|nr:Aspartic proteinase nepenthesin-2 [Nymphaea thermarum]
MLAEKKSATMEWRTEAKIANCTSIWGSRRRSVSDRSFSACAPTLLGCFTVLLLRLCSALLLPCVNVLSASPLLHVGGKRLPIPESVFQFSSDGSGGVVVDSGSTFTGLAEEAYSLLKAAFIKEIGKPLVNTTSLDKWIWTPASKAYPTQSPSPLSHFILRAAICKCLQKTILQLIQ